MKIAQLISTYLPLIGGAQVCVHNVSQRLVREGHHVVVITPNEFKERNGEYEREVLARGSIGMFRYSFFVGRFYLIQQIKKLQEKHNFDLWQVTIGFPFGVAVAEYFKKNRVPCVLRCAGADIQKMADVGYGARLQPRADHLIRKYYTKFDRLVAISETMKNEYLELGIPLVKIALIPNGVDCQRFEGFPGRDQVRLNLGLGGGEKLILTVGRNHSKKGFSLIPKIVKEVSKRRGNFQWLIVGEGSDQIMEQAKAEGVGRFIKTRPALMGPSGEDQFPAQELIGLYRAADVFVLPTFIETFGIVVIEALAAGLPVVTTSASGVDELIEQEQTGLKSAPGDIGTMAANIERVLADDGLAGHLSGKALEHCLEFDWDTIAARYEALYRDMVQARNGSRE